MSRPNGLRVMHIIHDALCDAHGQANEAAGLLLKAALHLAKACGYRKSYVYLEVDRAFGPRVELDDMIVQRLTHGVVEGES